MRPTAVLRCLLACTLLSLSALAAAQAPAKAPPPDRRIALTVDDLPWVQLPAVPTASILGDHRRLIAAIRAAHAPVVGFVNEGKLEADGKLQPERVAMLRDWLDAGAELGNHTYSHADLHAVGLSAYEDDILRGERQLRPLLQARGQTPRWFRHPYLRAGRDPQTKTDLARFLGEHGYRIAPVTVDNSDWIWAAAYLRTGEPHPAKRHRGKPHTDALKARLRRDYVKYMGRKLDYYEQQSQALLGYRLPLIWLIHANALNADTYGELIAMARKRGYRFIGLDEAMRDPAYERADAYTGPAGPSWLHRWAIGEKKPASFFAGEPTVPEWVLNLARLDSE
ncbi:polysaccharide deacetylase family protein [Lysobacter sp. K5869]|uniref:polysaccharide deacetylase family protein n=1 Tax=Lysobacter sp. K5869 TaxID=2820808 RepID=UPI001C05F9D9|nr:polysaccharide deacetylase family protein [Lysobacter sp. K5869]QWP78201.1 polysaccharide deacetylase family protein [Lysobacter sp. K5869]